MLTNYEIEVLAGALESMPYEAFAICWEDLGPETRARVRAVWLRWEVAGRQSWGWMRA